MSTSEANRYAQSKGHVHLHSVRGLARSFEREPARSPLRQTWRPIYNRAAIYIRAGTAALGCPPSAARL